MRYFRWKKVSGLGHQEILVYCDDDGKIGRDVREAQCSTVDGIPFTMKKKDLNERYEIVGLSGTFNRPEAR